MGVTPLWLPRLRYTAHFAQIAILPLTLAVRRQYVYERPIQRLGHSYAQTGRIIIVHRLRP